MPDPSLDKYRGCLLGVALGDAVGSPVETQHGPGILSYLHRHVFSRNFEDVKRSHGELEFPFGQVTDDTQMSLILAQSLIQHQSLDISGFRKSLVEASPRIVGMGSGTRRALKDGRGVESLGNGAAMRAAPVGLVFAESTMRVLRLAAVKQAEVTHTTSWAAAGSAVVAMATAQAMFSTQIEMSFFNGLASFVAPVEKKFSERLLSLGERIGQPWEDVLEWVREQDPMDVGGISGHVLPSVLWSLYSFAVFPTDVMGAIVTALRPGGDVDTMASIAASLVGAHSGVTSFPADLTDLLMDGEESIKPKILSTAETLFRHRMRISSAPIRE